ncbi:MAG: heavy-metal-associated domain-containing protein [Bacteroidetes bacterium]|nr:heavy-metal-associated domain-containing protein [Bacteroidota bacterium]
MKNWILVFSFAVLWMACNESNQTGISASSVVVEQIQEKGTAAKTIAKLSIEGMTCAHGCGGKIQKELEGLDGVKATDLDFVEERKVNVVSVEFDAAQLDENKMMGLVNGLADGKYKVVAAQRVTTTIQ